MYLNSLEDGVFIGLARTLIIDKGEANIPINVKKESRSLKHELIPRTSYTKMFLFARIQEGNGLPELAS
jgi:hypothetical protein